MRLARAEWVRLFARRFTRIMMAIVLLILTLIALLFAANTHKRTQADHDRARQEIAQQAAFADEARRQCEQAQRSGQDVGPNGCGFGAPPATEDSFLPYQFNFSGDVSDLVLVAAGILALFGFVVGASFIGAEWTSGGMTNLLLWRPRRIPVLATKLLTLMVGVCAVSIAFLAAWVATFWLIARYRGELGRLTSGFWQSLALTGGRATALAVGAAALGFALASLGRHTATALGVAVGYALVVEIGTFIVFNLLQIRYAERVRLSTYVGGWLTKRVRLIDYNAVPTACGPDICDPPHFDITWRYAAVVLGAVLVAALVAAFAAMRRRDVT